MLTEHIYLGSKWLSICSKNISFFFCFIEVMLLHAVIGMMMGVEGIYETEMMTERQLKLYILTTIRRVEEKCSL